MWGSYCTWRCSFCNLKGFGNSIHGTATIANKTSITWTAPTKQQHQPTVRLFCVRLGITVMYASSSFVQIHSCVKQMSASWTWIAVARKQGFLIKSEVYSQCKKDVHISFSLSLSLSLILPNPSTLHKNIQVSWGLHKCYVWWLHQPERKRAHYWDWAM